MIRTKPNDKKYEINLNQPVYVYKNLHKDCWSVRQDGLVKAHAKELSLHSCVFKVSKHGRARVLKEKRKNVHAGIEGYILVYWKIGLTRIQPQDL